MPRNPTPPAAEQARALGNPLEVFRPAKIVRVTPSGNLVVVACPSGALSGYTLAFELYRLAMRCWRSHPTVHGLLVTLGGYVLRRDAVTRDQAREAAAEMEAEQADALAEQFEEVLELPRTPRRALPLPIEDGDDLTWEEMGERQAALNEVAARQSYAERGFAA